MGRNSASALAAALELRGWSVWWDRKIPLGQSFDSTIEEAIAAARCCVVLWSRASIRSEWVRSEASESKRRNILIPAFLEPVDPPLAFRLLNGADLSAWSAGTQHAELDKLTERITEILANGGPSARPLVVPDPHGLPGQAPRPSWFRRPRVIVGAVALSIAGAVYGVYVLGTRGSRSTSSPAATTSVAPSEKGVSPGDVSDLEKMLKSLDLGLGASGGSAVTAIVILELGLHLAYMSSEQAASVGVGSSAGAVVWRVDPGPAQAADIRAGDVVVAVNAETISSQDDLRRVIRALGPGKSRYRVRRGSQALTIEIDCPACVAVKG